MLLRFRFVAAIVIAVLAATGAGRAADGLQLRVLSSRPDMVTGGDALVRVDLPAGVNAKDVKLTVNGSDATTKLKADANGRSLTGLVTGLTLGSNTLAATGGSKATAKLAVVNHPITGPVFSGPQEQPFVCMTDKFKLLGGGTLGAPLDANCSIATRIDYVYRSKTDGKLKPLADPKNVPADVEMVMTRGAHRSVHRPRRDRHDQPRHLQIAMRPSRRLTRQLERPPDLHLRRRVRAGLVPAGRLHRRRGR